MVDKIDVRCKALYHTSICQKAHFQRGVSHLAPKKRGNRGKREIDDAHTLLQVATSMQLDRVGTEESLSVSAVIVETIIMLLFNSCSGVD